MNNELTVAEKQKIIAQTPAAADLAAGRETVWVNPKRRPFAEAKERLSLSQADIDDAEACLRRFAPFIRRRFPETEALGGIIESPLTPIPRMRGFLNERYGAGLTGRLLLKQDSHLAVSGSVKARGGIYEVLRHTETLARAGGLLQDDYTVFDTPASRRFFSRYAIQVGSTGNLGLSIGIISAALGYRVPIHMSADARAWKKDLLRARGAQVIEYASDYSRAVQEGRRLSQQDPDSYFVDDENSETLFLGYATAAGRLKRQLGETPVDAAHPLIVYLPCGVGGAPGGITFGLRHAFGDSVYCVFCEPVQAPCMLLGMATGLHNAVCVQDIGLTGRTAADGLAVGRPSGFVGRTVEELAAGIVTVQDDKLFDWMRGLWETEGIFIEPSACAAFQGAVQLRRMAAALGIRAEQLADATHIAWATGGSMVPDAEREAFLRTA